jgi:hypothetical protein
MLRKALTASTATLCISRLAAESNFRRPPQPSPQTDDKLPVENFSFDGIVFFAIFVFCIPQMQK